MANIPHEYTVRGKATAGVEPAPDEWYRWFAEQIARHGYEAEFYGRTYTYLHVDGWKYWSMGDVINRERLPAESMSRSA